MTVLQSLPGSTPVSLAMGLSVRDTATLRNVEERIDLLKNVAIRVLLTMADQSIPDTRPATEPVPEGPK